MSEDEDKPSLAVALQYERETGDAPRVVATGRGFIADEILKTARESSITIEANPMLAEALSGVPVDESIPRELYAAVAEVIGFIIRTQARR